MFWRRSLPMTITFIIGFLVIIPYFIPHEPFAEVDSVLSLWFDIIAVFAFILGGGNLIKIHGNKIYQKARDWQYSTVTIAGFFITLIVGILKVGGEPWLHGDFVAKGTAFQFIYTSIFVPLQSTMFSLLAFYVASASYRAFRAKTKEATILLVSAFIILVGRTFVGNWMTSWLPDSLSFLHIPNLMTWIMSYPNLAGQRGIIIGIALGIISTSLKLILGIERAYLGGEGD